MRVRRGALRLAAGALLLATGGLATPAQTDGGTTDRGHPVDVGYDRAPRSFGRGGNREGLSFCRFVGDAAKPYISCSYLGPSSSYDRVESSPGIDRGYDWGPRAFVDVTGDHRLDFCRLVGDPHTPRMACLLASEDIDPLNSEFVDDQYGFQSAQPFKEGQTWVGSGFGDIDGNGRADFCYFAESGASKIACLMAGSTGFTPPQPRFLNTLKQSGTRADLPWGYQDVNADGRADFCHFIDSGGGALLQCLSETVLLTLQPPILARAAGNEAPSAGDSGVRVYSRPGLDLGYDWAPRGFADADNDKVTDYCRFVGDPHQPFIACATNLFANGDQYALRSGPIHPGLPDLPRSFLDMDYDNRADFCRFVQGPPNALIRCARAWQGSRLATGSDFEDTDWK